MESLKALYIFSRNATQLPHDGTDAADNSESSDDFAQVEGSKKRKHTAPVAHTSKTNRKAQSSTTADTRRTHFVWRSRESGTGEIHDGKNLKGHLDFLDTAGTKGACLSLSAARPLSKVSKQVEREVQCVIRGTTSQTSNMSTNAWLEGTEKHVGAALQRTIHEGAAAKMWRQSDNIDRQYDGSCKCRQRVYG